MSDAFLALVLGVAPGCETVSAWDEFLTSGATAEKSFVPLDNSHSSYHHDNVHTPTGRRSYLMHSPTTRVSPMRARSLALSRKLGQSSRKQKLGG